MMIQSDTSLEATDIVKIHSENLKWARKRAGINRRRAAKMLRLTWNDLRSLETGVRYPTREEVKRMAEIYRDTGLLECLNTSDWGE